MRRGRLYGMAVSLGCVTLLISCLNFSQKEPKPYTKPLEIVKLSDTNYLHISYIKQSDSVFIPCNGFIYKVGAEAVIFDTPFNDSLSKQLIDFVEKDLNTSIKGVVLTHFHDDAAGGASAFSKAGIPLFASAITASKIENDSVRIDHSFTDESVLRINEESIINFYPGEAHTKGNIVSYIPSQALLYGGCALKSMGATRGNIADANLSQWPQTIDSIQKRFPKIEITIPGHGSMGGPELLTYTKDLFSTEETVPKGTK